MMRVQVRELVQALVGSLPRGERRLFNPWADVCSADLPCNTPDAKRARLERHLDGDPAFILCGEAPGWQGMRHTGVAFTSEALIVDGLVPRVREQTGRLTSRAHPFAEPSATIVWRTLYKLGIEQDVVMWNALPLHPCLDGDPQTNRTPTAAELKLGIEPLRVLLSAFPRAAIVAVGQKAAGQLARLGAPVAAVVRHPARGGANDFALGLMACVHAHRK
jgi:uracil-DNA glycosylase